MPLAAIPKLAADQTPQFTFRPATVDDAEQFSAWDAYRARTSALSFVRTPEQWRFEITERHADEVWKLNIFVIVNAQGEAVGYVAVRAAKEEIFYHCMSYVVGEKSSYLATFDDVLRHLKTFAEGFYATLPEMMPWNIIFDGGMPAAVDLMLQAMPGGRVLGDSYAWYLRVTDTGALIQQLAPVLETRLAESGANAYTGTLLIEFFDLTGLEITFERGKIISAVQRPFDQHEGMAGCPNHSFLNLVFGHRTMSELKHIYPEAGTRRDARVLLDALFPKQRAWLTPLA
ncbi:MAG: hypothetical protein H7Y11_01875, partial [Armatimonadetes bacterium]|nr:hypothetical protein [Anaerolineae bacterium]